MLKITLKRSYIGIPEKQRKVLASLGLKKIGRSVTQADNEAIKGMVHKVSHLVAVERVDK
ncbi:MAG: 50S ribosomal protein L30 [Nitrospirota bacterium]|nr:50S ribosomal protein L30 [Nitrospirota bacterium]